MPADRTDWPEELKENVDRLDLAVEAIVKALIPEGYEIDEAEIEFIQVRVEYEVAELMLRMITVHGGAIGRFITEHRREKEEKTDGT